MKRQATLICMGFSALIAPANQGHAQGAHCGPPASVTTHLSPKYDASRRQAGAAAIVAGY